MECFPTGRGALAFVPRRAWLPLTREVASPKGLTEGEIDRACCEVGMRRAYGLQILSLSRLRRQLPRQREPRGGGKKQSPAADAGLGYAFYPRPPQVLPPSDEGGGKPEGLDGGRDKAGLR